MIIIYNMKNLFLIKNPEIFQGEKCLKKNKKYFEGWYFKNTKDETGISFIPGININEKEKKAFIQIITNDTSYFVNYDIDDFEFRDNPFYIKIGNNFFSKEKIYIDIKDKTQGIIIFGELKYSESKNIKTNLLNPNIMGPFSYIPFMECNHAILNMKNRIEGKITINDKMLDFNNGTCYMEKDWGCSFPKSYIWCQGNNFKKNNASFMLSIANIPFKILNFKGLICSLIIDNKEYRFATYNNTKLIKYEIKDDIVNIVLKKCHYTLKIKSKLATSLKLSAPVKGKMEKDIYESISANITLTLKKKNKIIFSDTSTNCGLEIVEE